MNIITIMLFEYSIEQTNVNTSEYGHASITAACDHVSNFSPCVQMWVVNLHRVHSDWSGEIPPRVPASDGVQQPVNRGYANTSAGH